MTISFSMTASGFTYTSDNNEEKHIVVDGENNKVDFQKFEITTPAATCRGHICYEFIDKACLQTAVDLWRTDRTQALILYGQINTWDVSGIADMSNLFEGDEDFNHDISNWNTSQVTNMNSMFKNCSGFNRDISTLSVDNVLDFTDMFENTKLQTSHNETKRLAIHTAWNGNASWSYQWGGNNNP
jgi:surface protein